jgi:2-oxoglutarate dehydrogenase E2 component (dihydrolipoamide succinyltransferase)
MDQEAGDPVKADEPIASLETDKVAVEVPSPVAGTMGEHVVAEGDTVAVGALIARIEAGEGAPAAAEAPQPAELAIPVNPAGAGESPALKEDPHAPHHEGEETGDNAALTLSPAVRRVVLEHGLDPSKIKGTGKDGRLTKDDVLAAAKTQAPSPSAPTSAPAQAGAQAQEQNWVPASAGTQERREERVRMTRFGRRSPAASRRRRTPPPCSPPSTTST